MMPHIDLYCFEKAHDEPSPSGYCSKLETLLRATDFRNYELKFTVPFNAPKGKLPYVVIDGKTTIADSHFITRYLLENNIIRDIDLGLTPAQRAHTRAWQGYTEEVMYPALVYTRSLIPENGVVFRREAFGNMPFLVRNVVSWLIYRRIRTNLYAQGTSRHSPNDIQSLLDDYVQNAADVLTPGEDGEFKFFHGTTGPTMADVVTYGFFVNALHTESSPSYNSQLLENRVLRRYIHRCTKMWFPEYTRVLQMTADPEEVSDSNK